MERAAAALDCDFVYAFVPREGRSLDVLLHEQARKVAANLVQRVGTSMALEAQGVEDREILEREVERVAADLVRTLGRGLWDR
jgi:hypothetical protein